VSSSGVRLMTREVITWETGSASSFGPCSVRPRTMSRSEIKPRTVFPSPLTTRAPMPFSFRSHATVKIVVLGDVVATLDPLDFRIDATFMMRPPILTPRSVGDALVALGRGFTRSTFYSDISKRIPLSVAHISISLVRMRSRVCVDEKAHARETGGEKLRHGSSLLSGRRNGEGHCGETEADPATNCQPRF